MSKKRLNIKHKEYFLLALLSLTLSTAVGFVPIIYELGQVYPRHVNDLHLTLTLPPLFMTLSAILVARLDHYIKKKDMLIGSYLLIGLSGLLPLLFKSFNALLISRACLGIGLGLLNPIVSSYPYLAFDKKTINKAEGVYASFSSLGAVLFTFLAVMTLKKSINLTLALPLLNLICLGPIILIYPSIEVESSNTPRQKLSRNLSHYLMFILVTIILTITLPLNLSLLNQEKNLLSLSTLALITSVNAMIGFVVGFLYPKLKEKLGSKLLVLALVMTAVSLLSLAWIQNVPLFFGMAMVFGFGTSVINPYFVSMINERSDQNSVLKGMSAMMVVMSIGQFISPFLINPISNLLGNDIANRFIVSGTLMMLLSIMTYISTRIALKGSFDYYD
ncbi:MFS transporter [Erysipelothrix urinaevulpis]|uniref:MFS transporter n=1 Tax=Erysipelothrix urinaevulpis TaxID=2683717 RepID=UPI00135AF301|nr:MFS transporter [Erysipelothrix urinaevulpis]